MPLLLQGARLPRSQGAVLRGRRGQLGAAPADQVVAIQEGADTRLRDAQRQGDAGRCFLVLKHALNVYCYKVTSINIIVAQVY